jgi:hypothetical protein
MLEYRQKYGTENFVEETFGETTTAKGSQHQDGLFVLLNMRTEEVRRGREHLEAK